MLETHGCQLRTCGNSDPNISRFVPERMASQKFREGYQRSDDTMLSGDDKIHCIAWCVTMSNLLSRLLSRRKPTNIVSGSETATVHTALFFTSFSLGRKMLLIEPYGHAQFVGNLILQPIVGWFWGISTVICSVHSGSLGASLKLWQCGSNKIKYY